MTTAIAAPKFTDLIAAECIKLRTLRTIPWFALVSAIVIFVLTVTDARAAHPDSGAGLPDRAGHPGVGAGPFKAAATSCVNSALRDGFSQPAAVWLMVAAAIVGALSILSEQATGQLRATFTAVPARRELIAAKLATVTALAGVFGAIVVAVSFAVDERVISASCGGTSLLSAQGVRVVAASLLLAPIGALTGVAFGVVLRRSAPTMVAIFMVLLAIPGFQPDSPLAGGIPTGAWSRLVLPHGSDRLADAPAFGAAWIVYGVWAALAIAATLAVMPRRDQ